MLNQIWTDLYKVLEGLGFDPNVLLQLFPPFLLTVLVVHFAAIKPILAALHDREHRTSGMRDEVVSLRERLAQAVERFEGQMNAAKQDATKERQRIYKEAIAAQDEVLASARIVVSRTLETIRTQVAADTSAAQAQLHARIDVIAEELASRALGREIGAETTASRKARTVQGGA